MLCMYGIVLKHLFQYWWYWAIVRQYFGRVAMRTCKMMDLCKKKAKNGFSCLKTGGYLAYTPWDTLLLALLGGGGDGSNQ